MNLVLTSLLLCIPFAVGGCAAAGTPARAPRETVEAYATAIRESRIQDAYALLSSEAKRHIDFKTFEKAFQENQQEMLELSQSLLGPSEPATVTAIVTGPSGGQVTLFYEDGEWKVDGEVLDIYSQSTPAAAIGAFVKAFENGRYDVLMRFVPEDKQEGLTAAKLKAAWQGEQKDEMQSLTQALKAALPTARIERVGDRATMSYGAGGTVELKLESDQWKIEEF